MFGIRQQFFAFHMKCITETSYVYIILTPIAPSNIKGTNSINIHGRVEFM